MKTKVDKAPNHVAEAPVLENIDILREEVQKHAATCLSCDSQNRDTKCFEKVKGIIIRSIPENRISTIKNQKGMVLIARTGANLCKAEKGGYDIDILFQGNKV